MSSHAEQAPNISRTNGHGHAGGDTTWWTSTGALVALVAALAATVPSPLVLPLFSIVTVLGGFALAITGWLRHAVPAARRERTLELAGMIVLIGFVAAVLADTEGALAAFDALANR